MLYHSVNCWKRSVVKNIDHECMTVNLLKSISHIPSNISIVGFIIAYNVGINLPRDKCKLINKRSLINLSTSLGRNPRTNLHSPGNKLKWINVRSMMFQSLCWNMFIVSCGDFSRWSSGMSCLNMIVNSSNVLLDFERKAARSWIGRL